VPTVFTHALVPLALGLGAGTRAVPPRLLLAGMAVAVVPDLDVLALHLGVPYGSPFGHRGFTHSLAFAALVAFAGMALHRQLKATAGQALVFLLAACASHGLLDAFTNGGSGIAFLWPVSSERYFAPVTPIEVSPIALSRFFSSRGMTVLWSEIVWVWVPCGVLMLGATRLRRMGRRGTRHIGERPRG
jgi:inner membrane protein